MRVRERKVNAEWHGGEGQQVRKRRGVWREGGGETDAHSVNSGR